MWLKNQHLYLILSGIVVCRVHFIPQHLFISAREKYETNMAPSYEILIDLDT